MHYGMLMPKQWVIKSGLHPHIQGVGWQLVRAQAFRGPAQQVDPCSLNKNEMEISSPLVQTQQDGQSVLC
jgi:hypothetical protein